MDKCGRGHERKEDGSNTRPNHIWAEGTQGGGACKECLKLAQSKYEYGKKQRAKENAG